MPGKGKVSSRKNKTNSMKKAPVTKHAKAGIIFPASRLVKMMKQRHMAERFGGDSGVFFAAVLQYLVSEVLLSAGEECHAKKMKTLKPKHLQSAIRGDEEMNKMLNNCDISSGGTQSNVIKELFPKNKV